MNDKFKPLLKAMKDQDHDQKYKKTMSESFQDFFLVMDFRRDLRKMIISYRHAKKNTPLHKKTRRSILTTWIIDSFRELWELTKDLRYMTSKFGPYCNKR